MLNCRDRAGQPFHSPNRMDYRLTSITVRDISMKTCTKCGETKPKTEFHKKANKKDGINAACKTCVSIAAAKWREKNPEKSRKYCAKWAAENPKKNIDRAAKYRSTFPDRIKEAKAKYRAANRERLNAIAAEYRAANPEKSKAISAKWAASNPEAGRLRCHSRRARERKNGGKLSIGLSAKLIKLQCGKCACCGLSLGDDYHLDHIVPLALGGANEDWNIQLLRSTCNLKKNAKHPIDYMQSKGILL